MTTKVTLAFVVVLLAALSGLVWAVYVIKPPTDTRPPDIKWDAIQTKPDDHPVKPPGRQLP